MDRSVAMRLVVYIRAFGNEPVQPTIRDDWKTYWPRLQQQYESLLKRFDESEKNRIKGIGRAAIEDLGLEGAADPFPDKLPDGREIPLDHNEPTGRQKHLLFAYGSDSAHLCTYCRTAYGQRKISWHSRELAEEMCRQARRHAVRMDAYKCPRQNGMWHTGRRVRKQKKLESIQTKAAEGESTINLNPAPYSSLIGGETDLGGG